MRNENRKMDIDALLRDTAQADNQALPFSDWKDTILQKAAAQPAAESAEGTVLAFAPPQKRRAVSLRQVTIGLSTVAAALLVVVGLRGLPSAQNAAAPAAAPAAPPMAFSAEQPAAGAGVQADMITPQADSAMLAEAAPMSPEADELPEAASAPLPEGGSMSGGVAAAAPQQSRMALLPEELEALHAVQAALGLPVDEGEFAYITLDEHAAHTVAPLDVQAKVQQLEGVSIYVVVPDVREDGESYAVDAQTKQVLGRIVY